MSQAPERAAITIEVLGQKLSFRGRGDPEHIEACTKLVQERLDAATGRLAPAGESKSRPGYPTVQSAKVVQPLEVVTLALFDLAEEYVSARRRTSSLFGTIRDRSERLRTVLRAPHESDEREASRVQET